MAKSNVQKKLLKGKHKHFIYTRKRNREVREVLKAMA